MSTDISVKNVVAKNVSVKNVVAKKSTVGKPATSKPAVSKSTAAATKKPIKKVTIKVPAHTPETKSKSKPKSKPNPEPAPESESESESEEPEQDAVNEESGDSDESEPDSEHDSEPEPDVENETGAEAESGSESETESETKPLTTPKRPDSPPPKPMSEEDVMEVTSKLSSLDAKDINEICDGYSRGIKGLISCVKKSLNPKTDEDELVELDRLMRLINMCPKDEIFIRSKDKIWHARYHILDRDTDWFLKRDYSANIKKDQKQRMIETLIRMIQGRWKKLSDDEKELYWEKAFEILNLVAKFKKLTNEA